MNGDVLLMENTRFEDLDSKKESTNDESLGKYWSSLGEIFINDAFGTCHRAHASNVGIASNLESGIGLCFDQVELERELVTKLDVDCRTYFMMYPDDKMDYAHTFLIYKDSKKY